MTWWVTIPGGYPRGPVSTQVLLRAIAVGKLPNNAFVRRIWNAKWRPLSSIRRFADALAASSSAGPSQELTQTFDEPLQE